jgi:transposase
MKIVGCDLHTRYQQIAMLDAETGELVERRLEHEGGEARAFYAGLDGPVRVGIEATGHTRWFERMLGELGQELCIGDAGGWAALTSKHNAGLFLTVTKKQLGVRHFSRLLRSGLSDSRHRYFWETNAQYC